MNKTAKRIILGITIPAAIAGAVITGLIVYRNVSAKPVSVYPLEELTVSDYDSDSAVTSGNVSSEGIQKVFLSGTQTVKSVEVTDGQKVKKGDILITYDTSLKDIEVERAKVSVGRLELELKEAQKELEELNNAQPHTTVIIEPDHTVTYTPAQTPLLIQGSGTLDDPLIYLFDEDDSISGKLLKEILSRSEVSDNGKKEDSSPEEGSGSSAEDKSGSNNDPEVENVDEASDDMNPGDTTEEEGDVSDGGNEGDGSVFVVVINREENAMNAPITAKYGLRIDIDNGLITGLGFFEPFLPENIESYEEQPEPYEEESGSEYTQEELVQLRLRKTEEITELKRSIALAKNEYEQKKLEINDSAVRAAMDGVITKVRSSEEIGESKEALVELSAGGAYYVTGTIGEFDLETVHVGDIVSVEAYSMSGDDGGIYDGEIVEISDKPATGEDSYSYFSYGEGNSNVTYYPFKVKLSADINLKDDTYVEIYYQPQSEADSGVYIMNAFIKRDSGDSYVYVKGEKGLLEKRSVRIGRSMWGSYTQVKSGLKSDDELAFPYGKDVKEGAKTVPGKTEDLYGDSIEW